MRILIIGLGSIAKKHIKALKAILPENEIFAFRSSSLSSNTDGITNIYSFSEISVLNLDFVIISNPTFLHQQTIRNLIPFKLPLFIEKPVFNETESGNLIDEVNRQGIKTYVACNLRFLDCLLFTKSFIKNKRINEINSYCGSYLPDWRPDSDFKKIYSANPEMGGGVHIDLIHEMDYLFWFFGMPEKCRSYMSKKSSLNIASFDYANYILEYPFFTVNIVLNYYRRDPKRSFEIVTNEGTIYVNLLKNEVTFNGVLMFTSQKTILDTYEDQMKYFLNTVLKNKPQFNTINEAYEVLKLCLNNNQK